MPKENGKAPELTEAEKLEAGRKAFRDAYRATAREGKWPREYFDTMEEWFNLPALDWTGHDQWSWSSLLSVFDSATVGSYEMGTWRPNATWLEGMQAGVQFALRQGVKKWIPNYFLSFLRTAQAKEAQAAGGGNGKFIPFQRPKTPKEEMMENERISNEIGMEAERYRQEQAELRKRKATVQ